MTTDISVVRWDPSQGPGQEYIDEFEYDGGNSSSRLFERSRIKALAEERESVQKKTFTKWVNSHLVRVNSRIGDLYVDMRDGKNLIKLLEVLSGERLPRPTKGKMRIHCLENVDKALQFLRDQRVHLENIGSHDIVDGNASLNLGLIWTIILRFQIQDITIEETDNNYSSEGGGGGGGGGGGSGRGGNRRGYSEKRGTSSSNKRGGDRNKSSSQQGGPAAAAAAGSSQGGPGQVFEDQWANSVEDPPSQQPARENNRELNSVDRDSHSSNEGIHNRSRRRSKNPGGGGGGNSNNKTANGNVQTLNNKPAATNSTPQQQQSGTADGGHDSSAPPVVNNGTGKSAPLAQNNHSAAGSNSSGPPPPKGQRDQNRNRGGRGGGGGGGGGAGGKHKNQAAAGGALNSSNSVVAAGEQQQGTSRSHFPVPIRQPKSTLLTG